MIHKFSAKNFYSIGNRIEVDLESTPSSRELQELYHESAFNIPVTKIAFFGGKNASGKTNTLRILAFIGYIMSSSSSLASSEDLPFFPCMMFSGMGEKPTEVSVSFSLGNDSIYTYRIVLTRSRIISEELDVTELKLKRKSTTLVFLREWEQKKNSYKVEIANNVSIAKMVREKSEIANDNPRVSLIVLLSVYDVRQGIFRKVFEYWGHVYSNITTFGSIESELSLTQYAKNMVQRIYNDKDLSVSVGKILKKFDIGFYDFHKQIFGEGGDERTEYSLTHIYNNVGYSTSVQLESNGTKRMIVLLRYIVAAIQCGGVAIIDELDAFLHPDIYDYIIDLFMSKDANPNGAQLIFSAHNYTILSRIEKRQIFLSDRNNDGETEVWRLDEMKGIRSDDNYYTHYLANCYGGKPNLEVKNSGE